MIARGMPAECKRDSLLTHSILLDAIPAGKIPLLGLDLHILKENPAPSAFSKNAALGEPDILL